MAKPLLDDELWLRIKPLIPPEPPKPRGIRLRICRRDTSHGSGLGKRRWAVEACFAWLFQFRRLRVRYEKRDDIHEAFLIIGCILICWNRIQQFC